MMAAVGLTSVPAPAASSSGEHGLGLKLSRPDESREFDPARLGAGRTAAASVDLSSGLPPIKDQGAHSSCVGFSAGYYAKTWWEKKEHPSWNVSDTRYQTSPAFIYNQINGGEDTGASIYDAFRLMETVGSCDWSEFSYDGDYLKQPDSTDTQAAGQYKISSDWGYFFWQYNWAPSSGYSPANDISQVKAWLSAGNPVVLGIPIYSDFPDYGVNTDSAYYTSADTYWPGQLAGGHAVFIAGYDDNANPYGSTPETRGGFKMVNSWGQDWNGNGTVWLSYKFVQKWVPEAWYFSDVDSSPNIASLSPSTGAPGDLVTISGLNLGAYRRQAGVLFQGGAEGTVVSWTNGQVKVRVPEGARSGSVIVKDWDAESSNGRLFTVGSSAAADWLMAEGATWPGYDEWVTVQNPNSTASQVTIKFMTPSGEVDGPGFTAGARSRVTVHVNEFVRNSDVSAAVYVTSGPEVCAERSMYVSAPDGKWGSHNSIAARSASETWYLAEGATWPGYDEWITVLNPNGETVGAQLTFHTPGGTVPGPLMTLGPRSRGSVHVNEHVPAGDVSTEVRCRTAGLGVVAERSMYVRAPDGKVGCHNSIGATETARGWGLAEGATWPGYEEWVTVQNPTGVTAQAQFIFMTPGGLREGPTRTVAPGKRVTVRVNDYVPDSDVSTLVLTGGSDQAVVVERALYVRAPDGKVGSHNSIASVYSSTGWYLPEGCTSPGFDEWVTVMNPDEENSVLVRLDFLTPGGQVSGPLAVIGPAARRTFHVNDYVAGDVSTVVQSDGFVVCERSMYMSSSDGKRGATCSLGLLASYIGNGGGTGAATFQALAK
jgi:IPT/TIG domain/Papain family cysteine protease